MHLLLIEDDHVLRTTLQRSLLRTGMRVDVCEDGNSALPIWRMVHPDVVVMDLHLPGLDGLELLQQARKSGMKTPVLILTARGTVGDRIVGLNAGADDYLPKPFDLDELEARIRALHHNAAVHEEIANTYTSLGDMRFERSSGAIYHHQQVLDLPPRELALMAALMTKPGQAIAKERLFELVFPGEAQVHYEAIEVVAYRLRKKLVATGVTLVTLRGLGYLLKAT